MRVKIPMICVNSMTVDRGDVLAALQLGILLGTLWIFFDSGTSVKWIPNHSNVPFPREEHTNIREQAGVLLSQ
jgi:hypothetical protein